MAVATSNGVEARQEASQNRRLSTVPVLSFLTKTIVRQAVLGFISGAVE
jgi:hypothetical protein